MKRWLSKLGIIALILAVLTVSYIPVSVQASQEYVAINLQSKNTIRQLAEETAKKSGVNK